MFGDGCAKEDVEFYTLSMKMWGLVMLLASTARADAPIGFPPEIQLPVQSVPDSGLCAYTTICPCPQVNTSGLVYPGVIEPYTGGVCVCECHRSDSPHLKLLDESSVCALTRQCRYTGELSVDEGLCYRWRVTQIPMNQCGGSQDRFGECGYDGVLNMATVCSLQYCTGRVIIPYVSAADIGSVPDSTNLCTTEHLLSEEDTRFPCGDRECETLSITSREYTSCGESETGCCETRSWQDVCVSEVTGQDVNCGLDSKIHFETCPHSSCDMFSRGTCNTRTSHTPAETKPGSLYIKDYGPCNGSCGEDGVSNVTFTPCRVGDDGCMIHDEARNTSEACVVTGCDCTQCVPEHTYHTQDDCKCACMDEYYGESCHLRHGAATYDVVGVDLLRCASGVVDSEGVCCATSVDSCGLCHGERAGVGLYRAGLDSRGNCCSSNDPGVFLTREFECCSGKHLLDECGVCGGDGKSCAKEFVIPGLASFNASTLDSVLAIIEGVSGGVVTLSRGDIEVDSVTSQTMDTSEVIRLVVSNTSLSLLTDAVIGALEYIDDMDLEYPEIDVSPVSGNSLCEHGETDGSIDCPVAKVCPRPLPGADGFYIGDALSECAGNGVCIRMSGICKCNLGYMGVACGVCGSGFVEFPVIGRRLCMPVGAIEVFAATVATIWNGGTIAGVTSGLVMLVLCGLVIAIRMKWIDVRRYCIA